MCVRVAANYEVKQASLSSWLRATYSHLHTLANEVAANVDKSLHYFLLQSHVTHVTLISALPSCLAVHHCDICYKFCSSLDHEYVVAVSHKNQKKRGVTSYANIMLRKTLHIFIYIMLEAVIVMMDASTLQRDDDDCSPGGYC